MNLWNAVSLLESLARFEKELQATNRKLDRVVALLEIIAEAHPADAWEETKDDAEPTE